MEECIYSFYIYQLFFTGYFIGCTIWTSMVYIHDDVMLCIPSCSTKKNGTSIPWLWGIGLIGGDFFRVYFMSKTSHTKQDSYCRDILFDSI